MIGGEDDLDSYIDSVSGLEDTSTTDTSSDTSTADDGGSDGTTADSASVTKAGTPTAKGGEAGSDDQQQQPSAKQPTKEGQQPIKDGQAAAPKLTRTPNGNLIDAKGNIVDEQGQIIAPAGKARRVYEDNQRLTTQHARVLEERNQFERQARENVLLNGIPAQYGLSTDEVARALDFAGRMKRGDGVGVAKDLIAMISAQGHNVSELLGETVGDSIDMKAVRHMLDERLGPITQARQEVEEGERARVEGTRQYERFVADNEYADVHGEPIVNLMKAQGISTQAAYNKLRQFAYDNQFDFSIPLGPQIVARQQGQQQAAPATPSPRPMPGNGAQTRPNGAIKPATPSYADPDEDWGSIIRRAM